MTKSFRILHLLLFYGIPSVVAHAQGNPNVNWTYRAEPISHNEALLVITADVLPGWHLYSQHIKEGGPMPTRFVFERSDQYTFMSTTSEKGNAFQYYDDLYEIDVIWYSGTVTFLSKISLTRPHTVVKGKVSYMACNDTVCVPGEKAFAINVDLSKQTP